MSLIQEALEKAAKHRHEPLSVTDITPSFEQVLKTIPAAERKEAGEFRRRRTDDRRNVILPAALTLMVIAGAALFFMFGKKKDAAPILMSGVSSIPQINQPVLTAPKFLLTGVTESNGQKLALINNQVVATGDRLKEKAFVKTINDESVVLDYQGREIKLSL